MSDPWLPFKRSGHPLAGKMDKSAPWQIRQALESQRPTIEQLDELAAEELAGKDRSEVYWIFHEITKPEAE